MNEPVIIRLQHGGQEELADDDKPPATTDQPSTDEPSTFPPQLPHSEQHRTQPNHESPTYLSDLTSTTGPNRPAFPSPQTNRTSGNYVTILPVYAAQDYTGLNCEYDPWIYMPWGSDSVRRSSLPSHMTPPMFSFSRSPRVAGAMSGSVVSARPLHKNTLPPTLSQELLVEPETRKSSHLIKLDQAEQRASHLQADQTSVSSAALSEHINRNFRKN